MNIAAKVLVFLSLVCITRQSIAQDTPCPILFVADSIVPSALDQTLREKLAKAGFESRTARYPELTEELLSAFRVVVVMQEPAYGQPYVPRKSSEIYREKVPLLLDFVKKGGGLYITHDCNINPQPQDIQLINETLLKPLNAELLLGTVVDPSNLITISKKLYGMDYCVTTKVAEHPITTGVGSIWYPVGPAKNGRDTSPIQASADWQVVLSGNDSTFGGGNGHESAKVDSTYVPAPAMAGVRNWGEGRVLLFPSASRIWFHSAYHPGLGGYVYENGDGFRFVTQALRWLAHPEVARTLSPLPPETVATPPRKIPTPSPLKKETVERLITQPTEERVCLGLIGLQSSYGSVEEFAQAAQKAGLSFVAFADDFESLNDEKYAKLVAQCKSVTTDQFIAFPGVRYRDAGGLQFVALDAPRLPSTEMINRGQIGSHDVRVLNHLMPYAPILCHQPGGYNPANLRFWNAIEVKNCLNGNLVDDSIEWYREIAANMQLMIPITTEWGRTPGNLADHLTWKTGLFVQKVSDIPQMLGQGFQRTFVTDGPVIKKFGILNPNYAPQGARWQPNVVWRSGDRIALKIDVAGEQRLRRVTLYWGKEIFRNFRPNGTEFSTVFRFAPAKDASLYLEVEDEGGHLAISAPLHARNRYKGFGWCTDQQNLICSNYSPEEDKDGSYDEGRYGSNYSNNPGRFDILESNLPYHETHQTPPGREVGLNQGIFKGVEMWPKFASSDPVESSVLYNCKLVFNSEDAYVLDLHWNAGSRMPLAPKGSEYFEWQARLINPRGRPYEPNFWWINTQTGILKDIQLGKSQGPEIRLLDAFFVDNENNQWPQFVAQGKEEKLTGATLFEEKRVTLASAPLARHGYVGLSQNYLFSLALYGADQGDYVARIANDRGAGNMVLGLSAPNQLLKTGALLRNRFLYTAVGGTESAANVFADIYSTYGFASAPASQVKLQRGRLLDQVFEVNIEASQFGAIGTWSEAKLPSCLLVQVQKLNPKWDAFLIDLETKTPRRVGIYETTGLTTLRCEKQQTVFIGNPIICSHSEIGISILDLDKDHIELEVHNPANSRVTTNLTSQRGLESIFPVLRQSVEMGPGETKHIVGK